MSTSSALKTATDAFAVNRPHEALSPFKYELANLGPFDIEVEISHCGICHSDLHLMDNDWNFSKYPLVPGHEIVGIVKKKGNLSTLQVGDRVGIGWQRSSCMDCEFCIEGVENLCSKQEATCVGHFGGFAKKIVLDGRFAFKIPDALPSEFAAPLLCGGVTVFSPLLQHQANALTKVGVVGIGGLGHIAIQFAHAFGCEVYAFSTSSHKEEEAKKFGAHHFILSKNKEEILKKAAHSVDLLLCTSSENLDWQTLFATLRPKGNLILLGAPKEGHLDLDIFPFIVDRKGIIGSNIGSRSDIRNMLQFAAFHQIKPMVEIFPMSEANKAVEKLRKNQVKYRPVLKN